MKLSKRSALIENKGKVSFQCSVHLESRTQDVPTRLDVGPRLIPSLLHVKNSRPRGRCRFVPSWLHLSQSDEGVVLERAERVVGQVEEVEAALPGEAAPLHHRDLVPAQLEVRQEDVRRKSGLHHADPA